MSADREGFGVSPYRAGTSGQESAASDTVLVKIGAEAIRRELPRAQDFGLAFLLPELSTQRQPLNLALIPT